MLPALRSIIGAENVLFAQVLPITRRDGERSGTVADAGFTSGGQIPVTPEGLLAIKLLKQRNIPTLGTTGLFPDAGFAGRISWRQLCRALREPD